MRSHTTSTDTTPDGMRLRASELVLKMRKPGRMVTRDAAEPHTTERGASRAKEGQRDTSLMFKPLQDEGDSLPMTHSQVWMCVTTHILQEGLGCELSKERAFKI